MVGASTWPVDIAVNVIPDIDLPLTTITASVSSSSGLLCLHSAQEYIRNDVIINDQQ